MTWFVSKGGSIYSRIEDCPFGMIPIIVINPSEARYVLAGIFDAIHLLLRSTGGVRFFWLRKGSCLGCMCCCVSSWFLGILCMNHQKTIC